MGKSKVRRAGKSISGTLTVRLQPNRPIPLSHGDYLFKFAVNASAARSGTARGLVFRRTPSEYESTGTTVSVRLSASNTTAQTHVNAGYMEIAYLDRGMLGGYTARWLTGEGRLEVKLLSVEMAK